MPAPRIHGTGRRVYKATHATANEPDESIPAPRWIGNSAPLHGTPGKPRSIRVTDPIWDLWRAESRKEGKSITAWLHSLAAQRLGIPELAHTNTNNHNPTKANPP
jgi:hypothetical protein